MTLHPRSTARAPAPIIVCGVSWGVWFERFETLLVYLFPVQGVRRGRIRPLRDAIVSMRTLLRDITEFHHTYTNLCIKCPQHK